MKEPHKHAELIKAWADGAIIQFYSHDDVWYDCTNNYPAWDVEQEYRIKPEPKPDYHSYIALLSVEDDIWRHFGYISDFNKFPSVLRAIHDGQTDKIKSVEVMK